jgi:sugar phosphate isomerase/epimerase
MFKSLNTGALSLTAPFDEALNLARISDFDGLDLPIKELVDLVKTTSLQDILDRFHDAGVRPGGWGLPFDFRGDDAAYQEGLRLLPECAALAQALGSPWCFTWILPFSDQLDYAANMDRHAQRLRPVASILADHGCRFGLEFVGPATARVGHVHQFIYTIDGALELADRIGGNNVGLLVDCWHWYTSHGTAEDLARLTAQQVVYVHVNDAPADREVDAQIDNQRLLPGKSGVIDIVSFLHALVVMGYEGPVVVEPFNAEVKALPAAERVRAAADSLNDIWAKAGIIE